MDLTGDTNWFAVHTKRWREMLAALSVTALGHEVFLPMIKVEYPEQEIIKVESKPLFTGYFFARFNPMVSLDAVESARGVCYVVKSRSNPIPVEERIVREIRDRVNEDGLIHLDRSQLKPGDRVSIQSGPFAGMMGRVAAELDDRRRVAIFLETLWQARVLIHTTCVELEMA
jgi:transcriptional antiterminator RfaH